MNQYKTKFPERLFACWHPVGYSHEIKAEEPFGTILLDEAIVIWRTSDGCAHAMRDLCIHRGTALSLGWIEKDCIVCPYHAWQYDKKGDCVLIPQAPDVEIPGKAKTPTYYCQEKFGLVWVALKKPEFDLPEIPEYENSDWKLVNTGPFDWNSDSSRQVENFTDFGHFPWVHPGLLGDPERPEVPDCKVTVKDAVLHYSVVRQEAANSDDFPIFASPGYLSRLKGILIYLAGNYSMTSHAMEYSTNAVTNIKITIEPNRITDSLMKLAIFISGSFVAL